MSEPWPMIPIQELLQPVSRPESVDADKTYRLLGAHWYAKGLYVKETKPGAAIRASTVYRVEQGDFVYNRLFAWMGSFAVVSPDCHDSYVSNEFPCFVARPDRLDASYLWRYFSRKTTWNEALGLSTGGTPTSRNRLKEEHFLSLRIPLPPLPEQRRIVGRIEALAERIEEAKGLHDSTILEAEGLVAAHANEIFNPVLRPHWPSALLGTVADIRSGVTLGRAIRGPQISIPYLRVANVQDGRLDLRHIKEVSILMTEQEKWTLRHGDILLTEGGDWDKLGRGTVWREEIPNCIHQNHIFRIRVNQRDFDPEFLAAAFASPYGKTYFQKASKQTTNLASINQQQLKAFAVFQPPLDEQRHVVAQLAALQERVNSLRTLQSEAAAELDALLPSILSQAFSGKL